LIKRKNIFFFNFETIKVLQTTAVFHSLHQRQDKALADQEQMILIITTLDLNETEYQELTAIKVPLKQLHLLPLCSTYSDPRLIHCLFRSCNASYGDLVEAKAKFTIRMASRSIMCLSSFLIESLMTS
jgi:hypothetical protein